MLLNCVNRKSQIKGSRRLRLWSFVAVCGLAISLCPGCADTDVTRLSGEYTLDIDATESCSPGSLELFKHVVLTLNGDGSFRLKCKFVGNSRTDKGTWSIAGKTIMLRYTRVGKRKEQFVRLASINDDRLTFDMRVLDGDVTTVFSRKTWPAWTMSIYSIAILVFMWVLYAKKDSPNVTFAGGSPEFVTGMFTVICLVTFVLGIVGTFKPEVIVWAEVVGGNIGMVKYFGFLALLAIGVVAWAVEERRVKNVLWVVFALGVITLLVWLYIRYGVEFGVEGG